MRRESTADDTTDVESVLAKLPKSTPVRIVHVTATTAGNLVAEQKRHVLQ